MSATFTVLGTTPLGNGLVRKRVKVVGDNAYPVAGYAITPANCGLSMFALNQTKTGFLDPVVTGVNNGGVTAEIVAQKLLLGYPTGGGTAAPATPAAPKVTTGASTASAVDATTPNITPGLGKAFVNNSDASSLTIFFDAYGYPA